MPERASEVRWLFVKERTGHVYEGYWYDMTTGKKVSDSYRDTFAITVYDLLTGETTQEETGDIGKCMAAYFGLAEE